MNDFFHQNTLRGFLYGLLSICLGGGEIDQPLLTILHAQELCTGVPKQIGSHLTSFAGKKNSSVASFFSLAGSTKEMIERIRPHLEISWSQQKRLKRYNCKIDEIDGNFPFQFFEDFAVFDLAYSSYRRCCSPRQAPSKFYKEQAMHCIFSKESGMLKQGTLLFSKGQVFGKNWGFRTDAGLTTRLAFPQTFSEIWQLPEAAPLRFRLFFKVWAHYLRMIFNVQFRINPYQKAFNLSKFWIIGAMQLLPYSLFTLECRWLEKEFDLMQRLKNVYLQGDALAAAESFSENNLCDLKDQMLALFSQLNWTVKLKLNSQTFKSLSLKTIFSRPIFMQWLSRDNSGMIFLKKEI